MAEHLAPDVGHLGRDVALGKTDWANGAEIAALGDHYEDTLEQAGFFFPDHKAQSMKQNLRNLWSRMPLTQVDVRMLHGVLRQMVRWKDKDQ